ncbi:CPBP family intramembrane glutamic endopeptidase [Leucobacter salsicius]|uniref:CPBP family intramembrane glutamic endopeptidase n=1 Tax=Leucobacter salsicius TaxID=664638 RepID=UPI00034847F2|nr:CPBP family intramembrane glutamic endopeptidase [Leucobacter salsicius]
MDAPRTPNRWQRFWGRGGWWRAILLAVVYLVLYQAGSLLFAPLLEGLDVDSPGYIVVTVLLPVLLGSTLLLVFSGSLGWLGVLFGKHRLAARGWMWIAVGAVLLFNVLRMMSVDYGAAGGATVLAWLCAGLAIGLAEELLTRGLVVQLMRRAGYREFIVALASATLFSLLHASNLISGQSVLVTGIQLLYTFAFGVCMYLTLRVTGRLIWPILLHATTDPSIFLLSAYPTASPLSAIAGLGNFVVIAVGFITLWCIRGQVTAEYGQFGASRQASGTSLM